MFYLIALLGLSSDGGTALATKESTSYTAKIRMLKEYPLTDVDGLFFCGGGYVSVGEGASMAWGLNKFFNDGTLADLFSNKIISTNSGGGWFFNQLLYSTQYQGAIMAETRDEFIKKLSDYTYGYLSVVYEEEVETLRSKTESGEWTAMSISDYMQYLKRFKSWEQIVTTHHYSFTETPSLGVKNTHWVSLFGLAQDYNDYYLQTEVPMLEDPQRSTWHKAIPASIDYTFTEPRQNPEIDVNIPALENWYSSICSIRKTNQDCSSDNDCMANSYCDTGKKMKSCICNHGYTAITADGVETCKNCLDIEIDESEKDKIRNVEITWERGFLKRDKHATLSVDEIKDYVRESINHPKKYSGPSSAAVGAVGGDYPKLQKLFNMMGLEFSWTTSRLETQFHDKSAPRLSLTDGGAQDNCGITGQVRAQQEGIALEDLPNQHAIIVGMCKYDTVMMLISNGDHNGKLYEVFEFEEGVTEPSLEYEGSMIKVWGFEVKTLWEPTNGVRHGSHFIIYSFEFKIRSNYVLEFLGGGNFGKSEDEIEPLMSLMSGRGEVFELEISASGIVDDMAELYNFVTRDEESPSEVIAKESIVAWFQTFFGMGQSVVASNFLINYLAVIGIIFVPYVLIKIAFSYKRHEDFSPIDSSSTPLPQH